MLQGEIKMATDVKTEIRGSAHEKFPSVLTTQATDFIASLHREFNGRRKELLQMRAERQKRLDAGEKPDLLDSTAAIRSADWRVASCPADLKDRRVEITGPAEAKMTINALNSGARVFMADFEDSLSPTWSNIVSGQDCLQHAVRRTLRFETPEKTYSLGEKLATLLVRPRGWHLEERHFLVDGEPVSGSLFDFGLYFFHNARELIGRGSGPYFYLPKLESHLEARLWNDVFNFAQDRIGVPRGTIRATVLIETILAAFEMDEILYELRDHSSGLNAGRWDYTFSFIKKFRSRPEMALPDRAQVTMTVPFMRAYTQRLVSVCHRRGAHAMGGMAAFIPNRKDPEVTRNALAKVREDKEREVNDGFDGTWVAHPDLVNVATEIFDRVLANRPNQVDRAVSDSNVKAADFLNPSIPGSSISEAGIRLNVNVALQYLERWLAGTGAAAIHNLMEDAATAEISRAQIWQWIRHRARMNDGRPVTAELYKKILGEELSQLGWQSGGKRQIQAVELLDGLVLSSEFMEFLTIPAYQALEE
jgi:malate synthase